MTDLTILRNEIVQAQAERAWFLKNTPLRDDKKGFARHDDSMRWLAIVSYHAGLCRALKILEEKGKRIHVKKRRKV